MEKYYNSKVVEREIHFSRLLYWLWKRKSFIIIGTVIISIIIVFMGYCRDWQIYTVHQQLQKKIQEGLVATTTLSEEQQEKLSKWEAKEKALENCNLYNQKALYMTYDPYSVCVSTIEFKIEAENIEEVKAMYNNFFVCAKYEKNFEVENEILQITEEIYDFRTSAMGSDLFVVVVTGKDEQQVKELSLLLERQLFAYQDEIKPYVGSINLTIVEKTEIMNSQPHFYQKIIDNIQYKNDLEKECKLLRDELVANGVLYDQQTLLTTMNVPRIELVYILVGVIVGVFVMVILFALEYLISDKLKEEEDIKEMFGIKYLGNISKGESSDNISAVFRKIDLYKCDKEKGDSLINILTSLDEIDVVREIVDKLSDFEWDTIGNMSDIEESVIISKSKNAVILIEKKGVSRYSEIMKMVEKCKELELEIAGYVCIE